MRRGVTLIPEVVAVRYGDLVHQAGGKLRLRRAGRAAVLVDDPGGRRRAQVLLVERPAWRGGSRSFLRCVNPACGAPVLQLLLDPVSGELRCAHCWEGTTLRYPSQERRRVGLPRMQEVSRM